MALFNLLLFTIVFSAIIFGFFYLNYLHAKKTNKDKQLQGLAILKKCRGLLTLIQQHRGLSMGYLNSDDIFEKRITALENKINQTFNEINLQEDWLRNNLMWLGIHDHWLRLLSNYTKYESDYNFRQHCNLIINLLNIIEYCAEQHHLQALFCTDKKNNDFIWSQLLITAENIGQVRAIGTSIAAAKTVNNIEKIHLNYLQNCINDFLKKPNYPFDKKLIIDLLNILNNEIISCNINISAEDFFNLSTLAIDDLLANSDEYLNNFTDSK